MPKQPMTRAREILRPIREHVGPVMFKAMVSDIATAIAKAETRGFTVGVVTSNTVATHTFDTPTIGAEILRQAGQQAADFADLGLTAFDMRAVRKAFKEG